MGLYDVGGRYLNAFPWKIIVTIPSLLAAAGVMVGRKLLE